VLKPDGGSYMLNARLDAEYEYYLHGPLRRVELGDEENKVQGLDYAYTLQGWLKGLNGTALTQNDMGSDGNTIAQDALAFSLGYYQHDYKPIGGTSANALAHAYQPNTGDAAGRNLYNGNISHSTYAIMGINGGATAGYTYGYDQLNRIKMLRQHSLGSNGDWNFSSATDNFKEQFSYDGNGNILALNRYNQNGSLMDNLSYTYNRDINNRLLNNRLNHVANPVAVSGSVAGTSYEYDAIGNLIKDTQEGISNINWNVYGKIKSITKNSGNISYTYDAAGNRVSKTHNGKSTYYLRDAQGNTLAVYDKKGTSPLYWREQHLYGSSRLGLWQADIDAGAGNALSWDTIGKKRYELNNHLGNVMAVISDSRNLVGSNYVAQLWTANDYYAFGSPMPGRSVNLGGYRYGFNGKENDNEVKGGGGQQDYGMRIYDPRLGRFLSVDPLYKSFPWNSSYAFAENRVISGIDLDGGEYKDANGNPVGPLNEAYASKIGATLQPGFKTESQFKTENFQALLKKYGVVVQGEQPKVKPYNILEKNHDMAMSVQIMDGVVRGFEAELTGAVAGKFFKYGKSLFSLIGKGSNIGTGYAAKTFEAIVKGAEVVTIKGAKETNLLANGSAMEAFGGLMKQYGKTVDDLTIQATKQGSSATFTAGKETYTLYNQASQGSFSELSISRTLKYIAEDGSKVKDVTKVRFKNDGF
jgi:RHS repeat-associated protein